VGHHVGGIIEEGRDLERDRKEGKGLGLGGSFWE